MWNHRALTSLRHGLGYRETEDAYYIEGRLRGFRRKDLDIYVRDRTIDIRAERDRGLFRREHRSFRRTMALPEGADLAAIDAQFDGDDLSIRIGKLPRARRRKVPISRPAPGASPARP
jgi:HSP20 family molecular chaperone IbpA